MPALGEYSSSIALALVVAGVGLLLPAVRRDAALPRALLCLGSVLLHWRYVWWRFSATLPALSLSAEAAVAWSFAVLEAAMLASATLAAFVLSRTCDRKAEAARHANWYRGRGAPRVDLYIVTYDEERAVLERTIAGALRIDYPALRIFVLDDGRRPWLAYWCSAASVGYLTRPDNAHAKAGNINNAFRLRRAGPDAPEFIAVLDADFVPHRDFVRRALALFHDARTGLVQSPQHFFNPDPIQHNLGIAEYCPNEQRFFFDHVEPARDAWGTAVCAGTSCVIRAAALEETGGFPTDSVTEDFLLSLALAEKGWRTVYLTEPLTEGLAPEGLPEYIVQRTRWCLGMMQIVRGRLGPLGRSGLGVLPRIGVLDSLLYWAACFPFRLASILCPLTYWYFGFVAVDASLADVLRYFVPAYLASVLVLNWLSRGLVLPIVNDVSQLVAAWPVMRAVLAGLLGRGPRSFQVTPKGGDRGTTIVHWPLLAPFLALLVLTLGGLCLFALTDYPSYRSAGDGRLVVLFWTVYNLAVLALAAMACIERPREPHPLCGGACEARLSAAGRASAAWLLELSPWRARVRGPEGLAPGEHCTLRLDDIGPLPAAVERATHDGYVLALRPTESQRMAILARLHTAARYPGIVAGRAGATYLALARGLLLGPPARGKRA